MNLDEWNSWVRILRDTTIVLVGAFMLIYETVFVANPNAYVIGGGLAALGIPATLRADLSRGNRDGDKK